MTVDQRIKAYSIWVSDLHLGSKGSRVREFLLFLDRLDCKQLILNGDIVDKFFIDATKPPSNDEHAVIEGINQLSEKGVSIRFCIGNHDKRSDISRLFPAVKLCDDFVYNSRANKRYWVLHGHQVDYFDLFKRNWIGKFGVFFYEAMLSVSPPSRHKNRSFSRLIKRSIKRVMTFLFMYEYFLKRSVHKQQVQGLIYAHTHHISIASQPRLTQ